MPSEPHECRGKSSWSKKFLAHANNSFWGNRTPPRPPAPRGKPIFDHLRTVSLDRLYPVLYTGLLRKTNCGGCSDCKFRLSDFWLSYLWLDDRAEPRVRSFGLPHRELESFSVTDARRTSDWANVAKPYSCVPLWCGGSTGSTACRQATSNGFDRVFHRKRLLKDGQAFSGESIFVLRR